MECELGLDSKKDCRSTPCRSCTALVLPICEDKLQIIYKNNKPYGIRDKNGFLFFFPYRQKYPNQEERYRLEVEQQFRLADFLLEALGNQL